MNTEVQGILEKQSILLEKIARTIRSKIISINCPITTYKCSDLYATSIIDLHLHNYSFYILHADDDYKAPAITCESFIDGRILMEYDGNVYNFHMSDPDFLQKCAEMVKRLKPLNL